MDGAPSCIPTVEFIKAVAARGLSRSRHSLSGMEEKQERRHLSRYDLEESGRGLREGDTGDVRESPMHLAFTTDKHSGCSPGHWVTQESRRRLFTMHL